MEQLVNGMLRRNVVRFGASFQLKDGRRSVAYVNLRNMISMPGLFDDAVKAYAETLRRNPELIINDDGRRRHMAGIPEAATPYAGAVAYEIGGQIPLLQRRVKLKEHGQPNAIEGRFTLGDELVLLDDVITSAESKLAEAEIYQAAGVKTTGVIVLVDRQQGGRTELESRGIGFVSAMTLSGIARYALSERKAGITQGIYDELLSELDQNELADN